MNTDTNIMRLSVPGAEFKVISAGQHDKTPIVFIPGWAGHNSFWSNQVHNFAKDHFVVVIDFPGFGDSKLDYEPSRQSVAIKRGLVRSRFEPLSMNVLSSLVLACLDKMSLKSAILVGHSAGGALALNTAALAPNRVQRVIGADAFTFMDFYPVVPEEAARSVIDPMQSDFDSAVRGVAESYFLDSSDPALVDKTVETMAAAPKAAALAILYQFFRWDMMDCLQRYEGPVAAISASATLDHAAVRQTLQDRISIHEMENTGHFVMLERPEVFNQLIREILL